MINDQCCSKDEEERKRKRKGERERENDLFHSKLFQRALLSSVCLLSEVMSPASFLHVTRRVSLSTYLTFLFASHPYTHVTFTLYLLNGDFILEESVRALYYPLLFTAAASVDTFCSLSQKIKEKVSFIFLSSLTSHFSLLFLILCPQSMADSHKRMNLQERSLSSSLYSFVLHSFSAYPHSALSLFSRVYFSFIVRILVHFMEGESLSTAFQWLSEREEREGQLSTSAVQVRISSPSMFRTSLESASSKHTYHITLSRARSHTNNDPSHTSAHSHWHCSSVRRWLLFRL